MVRKTPVRIAYSGIGSKTDSVWTGNPKISSGSPLSSPARRVTRTENPSSRLSVYGIPTSMQEGPSARLNARRVSGNSIDKRIVVVARKRPLTTHESKAGTDCILADDATCTMQLSVQRVKLDGINRFSEDYLFTFDRVYGETRGNRELYEEIVEPLVCFSLHGGTSTVFAYGQTGSGKTFTMFNSVDGISMLIV